MIAHETSKIMTQISFLLIFVFLFIPSAHSSIIYQDFEKNNGTPSSYSAPAGSPAEYGWGFNGAVVEINNNKDGVHAGEQSLRIITPAGKHVHAGGAVPAQTQTFHVNFVPECHDRLTFWTWTDPSNVGDHTVMVKFFDQGVYKEDGIGVWTTEKARYREWTQLTIPFSQLPQDFNLHRVDKIEFFNYWDGTYYFDDIEIRSAHSSETDMECLRREQYLSCLEDPAAGTDVSSMCRSVFSPESGSLLTHMQARLQMRMQGLELMNYYESR